MVQRLAAVGLVVFLLLFGTVSIALADTVAPQCSVPNSGARVISGQWDTVCAGSTVTIYDSKGKVLGTAEIQDDGSFRVELNRALKEGETISADCDCGGVVTLICPVIGPIQIPEPGTLLMLGTGLAGLMGYAGLRWRARR